MKGIIFDIQHYAIYDGPGIRTLVFLKGCPLHCLWCQNPESQKLKPQIGYFKENCVLCGKCIESCPENALRIDKDEINRNENKCVLCKRCLEICPNNALEIIGEKFDVEEVVSIVLKDKPFYDHSGGGITISGGEPTMQREFLLNLLTKLKEENVHTAIETCGYFDSQYLNDLVKQIDLFLFDLKLIDSQEHKELTGANNEIILNNFKEIHQKVGDNRIICRVPLIPGISTKKDRIQGILNFLRDLNYKGEIHLMPYNKLTKTKYAKIGKVSQYHDFGELTEEKLQEIIEIVKSNSFTVLCNE
jgi:pyruvate formate lyase activating enzyme